MWVGFRIDKLTNSIESAINGDRFQTEVTQISRKELGAITKANGWQFNWKQEAKIPERQVFKLVISGDTEVIQGLMSVEAKMDHLFMHLIESAPFNKGKSKVYVGVPGNLVAYACKLSFEKGFDGNVAFISKTKLIDHYTLSLGAFHFGGGVMIIENRASLKLVNSTSVLML